MITHGNDDANQTDRDRAESPSSETETRQLQSEPSNPGSLPAGVKQLPGTGGPDDSGDVDVVGDDINPAVIAERGEGPLPASPAQDDVGATVDEDIKKSTSPEGSPD